MNVINFNFYEKNTKQEELKRTNMIHKKKQQNESTDTASHDSLHCLVNANKTHTYVVLG